MKAGSPRVLLVVGGGIAAYKSCELVRLIRKGGGQVTCVVTDGGHQFVTPMALAALSENQVYTSLWDLKNEAEMGHIQLSREADLVVVCPATADMLAKMAAGIADDLATTLILATDKPVMAVPAMNVRMWEHGATQRNVAWLKQAGVTVLDPDEGAMACGEFGPGRLPEPEFIWASIAGALGMDVELPERPVAVPQAAPIEDAQDEPEEAPPSVNELAAEALEPEEDYREPPARSGLGSLLSAIIPRSTPKRAPADFEKDFALPPAEEEFASDEQVFEDAEPVDAGEALPAEEETAGEPDLSNPLFAKKGSAASAPPTDPEAMNHTVITGAGKAMPEPVAFKDASGGDTMSAPIALDPEATLSADPLAGQPEFDADPDHRPLYGRHVLVTAGPTWEPIDPVRYLANRSSGRQGFAIAAMAAAAGARVTLISGPVHLPTPVGVDRIDVESADEMAAKVKQMLPADVAFMVAAVADWRTKDRSNQKMKKRGSAPPALMLTENPDILTQVAASRKRPKLLVGFAAETENVIENATTKRKRKGADWIVANDVSGDVMGGDNNQIHIVTSGEVESFDTMPKMDVARELVARAADALVDMDAND
ncbi:bifunctional phosphopantothenoylcysteine decarboxylase/phosphopantothenate synthase [Altererythrobacter sp. HHU K3-1]|uniref:Coenzyme A biosynthesis bifunctional protein CoaBC n=2 Tax=Qipengyuania atrilutea TaxID=2744473 RepID=A0A850GYZ1_9SPHN|nr:bifunctional phosphopantothenoylcysteine decarboxylase/phosphopantothenate synthase [Actirhodobacter atriluteus]NVD44874.1 bifunctional phosphopantothenoylcysteine decarboxylase/phosphopantothenate synthase [Actirhodobacter atriluteus]